MKNNFTDNVFIYFADHGASGLIAFPSSKLYAKDLIATLGKMTDSGMYGKLVFYLEVILLLHRLVNLVQCLLSYPITLRSTGYRLPIHHNHLGDIIVHLMMLLVETGLHWASSDVIFMQYSKSRSTGMNFSFLFLMRLV